MPPLVGENAAKTLSVLSPRSDGTAKSSTDNPPPITKINQLNMDTEALCKDMTEGMHTFRRSHDAKVSNFPNSLRV